MRPASAISASMAMGQSLCVECLVQNGGEAALHDVRRGKRWRRQAGDTGAPWLVLEPLCVALGEDIWADRSEEHTSELQSLMRISYAVFCLKKTTYRHAQIRR